MSLSVYAARPGQFRFSNSERKEFRRCRRLWNWHYREGYIPKSENAHRSLWFGTGFHYALEDYHGYRHFSDPMNAFEAYVESCSAHELPEVYDDLIELAGGMLAHYTRHWLPRRDEFRTLWIDGVPQVEVEFEYPLMVVRGSPPNSTVTEVYLVGTFDRVVLDTHNRLYVQDYKTTSRWDVGTLALKLPTDGQISTYALVADARYGAEYQVEGVLYTQFKKKAPDYPKELKSGGFSQDRNANTTYGLYVEALRSEFDGRIPDKYREYVNYLVEREQPEGDAFIYQMIEPRNASQREAERWKLKAEASEMLLPQLALYPNSTDDCARCAFRDPCIAMDEEGSEAAKSMLDVLYDRTNDGNVRQTGSWRTNLRLPVARTNN